MFVERVLELNLTCLNEGNINARSQRLGYKCFVQGYMHNIMLDVQSEGEVIVKS